MPPTGYTEVELESYMHTTLGPTATALGWSVVGGNYAEPVSDTLLALSVDDIATITGADNINKLRIFARLFVWKAAVDALAAMIDIQGDRTQLNRSQTYRQAKQNLDQAQEDAASYVEADWLDANYRVGIDPIFYKHDPYAYAPDELRTP